MWAINKKGEKNLPVCSHHSPGLYAYALRLYLRHLPDRIWRTTWRCSGHAGSVLPVPALETRPETLWVDEPTACPEGVALQLQLAEGLGAGKGCGAGTRQRSTTPYCRR